MTTCYCKRPIGVSEANLRHVVRCLSAWSVRCKSCGLRLDQGDVAKLLYPDDELASWFYEQHRKSPRVYDAFLAMAREIRDQGHKRYGAKTIMERLRWESAVRYEGWDFKLSNQVKDRCSARYARMVIEDDPSFEGFFSTRKLTSAKRRKALSDSHKRTKAKKSAQKHHGIMNLFSMEDNDGSEKGEPGSC